jgi:hypothetical protein
MKELITESQADLIVALLAVAATLFPLGLALYRGRTPAKGGGRMPWPLAALYAGFGPAIWVFWLIYNSIENYYGLDSLKALEINFFIMLGFVALFSTAHFLLARRLQPSKAPRRRRS